MRRARRRAPVWAPMVIGFIACTGDLPTEAPSLPAAVRVSRVETFPKSNVTLPAGATQLFTARVTWSDGVNRDAALVYEATDGTIDSTGIYKAPNRRGQVKIIVRTRDGLAADTAVVNVTDPQLTALAVSPKTATVTASSSLQLGVSASWSHQADSLPRLRWSTPNGGSVSGAGLFAVPAQGGTYRVVVAHQDGTLGDTATVTVVPASLMRLKIVPDTLAMLTGAQHQFSAAAEWSDGSTMLPQLSWSRLGAGSVSTTGRYTAPSTAGTYGVVVRHSGGILRDTAVVRVVAPAPTVTSFRLSPDTLRLQRGQSAALVTSVTWSDGAARAVSVTYAVTGGTMVNGVYTAGQMLGTFLIIATCGCGVSDTTAAVIEEPTVPTPVPTVTSFNVSPDTLRLQRGQSGQLSTAVTWSDKATRTVSVSFAATGGTVANNAYTAGQVVGAFMVVATCACGAVDTTRVIIEDPPAGVAPWREVDFSTFTSSTQLRDDGTVFLPGEISRPAQITLETDGGFGSSGKRMRYNFPVAGCNTDYQVGRAMQMPPNAREVWVEVVARFAPNFKAAYEGNSGCSYAHSYKFLFLVRDPGRWEIQPQGNPFGGLVTVGHPTGVTNVTTSVPFMSDGQWHVWRWHARYGTNGSNRIWVDGQLIYSFSGNTGEPSNASMPFYGLTLGANSNNGFSAPTSLDWGRVRMYTTNPGW